MKLLMHLRTQPWASFLLASLASVGLLAATVVAYRDWEYIWLPWNLALAWVPFLLALLLLRLLRTGSWLSWRAVLLTAAWLLFLPNSFYMVTDFIHLAPDERHTLILDILALASFAISGLMLGFAGLYLLHRELRRRIGQWYCWLAVAVVLLVSSYGIYLGRFLHWNSWDVVVNAPSVLFDVSDTLINFTQYGQFIPTVSGFFVLLGSFYVVVWQLARSKR